jgi:hypothetical protein
MFVGATRFTFSTVSCAHNKFVRDFVGPAFKNKTKTKNKSIHTMTSEAQRESAVSFVDHYGQCHVCLPPRGRGRRLHSCLAQVRPAAGGCFRVCCYVGALIGVLMLMQQVVTFARQAGMEQWIMKSAAAKSVCSSTTTRVLGTLRRSTLRRSPRLALKPAVNYTKFF